MNYMNPKIIIDGYNMLHLVSQYKRSLSLDLETARDQLIRDLQVYRAQKKVEIYVVFDGSAETPAQNHQISKSGVNIIFSQAPLKADPVIMKMIQSEKRKKRISIVSEDQEIIRFAHTHGCQSLSPQMLYDRLKMPTKGLDLQNKFDHPMSEEELEEWQRIFGIDNN